LHWRNWQQCELCLERWSSSPLWIWGLSFRRESWRVWQKWWNSIWELNWWTGLSHFLLLGTRVYLFCSIFSMILPRFVWCTREEGWWARWFLKEWSLLCDVDSVLGNAAISQSWGWSYRATDSSVSPESPVAP
jgi:hypothetical protein